MTGPVALDVDIEHKRFPSQGREMLALQGLRLRLVPGEFVCLVGPSGCGKSTLLNIVNGLDRDYRGRVEVPGGVIATMFQTPRLMPWLSALDNVRLVLEDTPQAEARARELLAEMRLGDRLHAFPGQLSGGMQRRVALARAFAIRPQLLLMDEPFVSLDQPTANRLRAMLAEQWQRERASVLFVTHDLREALALADRVVFMSASPGRVVLEQPLRLPRPRDPDSAAVSELHQELLARHPELLTGLTRQTPGPEE